jgi:hypothetical protein
VLEGPSWWTPGHALVVLALALTVTLVVLAWVVVLRRRVQQRRFSSWRANSASATWRSTTP